jgi:enoyl-CoA hydratase/carnithine racemase
MEAVGVEDVALTHGTARILTLARPDERNPLDHATVTRLRSLTEEADADSVVRAVIVTGAGSAFSAGGDLRAYMDMYDNEREFRAFLDEFRALNARLEHGRFASIAMVNGPCVAGGLELALACDLRVAADGIRLGMPPAKLGLVYSHTGLRRFIEAVGVPRPRELFLLGRNVDARTAAAWGLVNALVLPADLEEEALEWAAELAANAPLSVRGNKRVIRELGRAAGDLDPDVERELIELRRACFASEDLREGVRAFAAKRPARWRGR